MPDNGVTITDGTNIVGGTEKVEGVKYAVWVDIEMQDEANDKYESLDAPGGALVRFDTYKEAYEYAKKLNAMAEQVQ